jgi:NADH-ubiquinone oxidoreductase chain 5
MYLSILILPLLGSVISGFMGRKIGVTGAHLITCTCLILASILASIAFYEVGICGSPVSINLVNWVDSEFMSISWEFLFDQLTVSMFIPVLYISSLIHIFSTDYMSTDPHNQRFFSYLSLFTFFMLLLVSGANFFVMFVGWEGIGIVWYLLINFWFTRIQANKAAILALTMNRVGDMGLSIGFFAIFALFGSLNYATIFSIAPFMYETAITIIALLLLAGAMAKSSQIPLHSWLPGSMEGPTPVSALIHAATLVTAGIYLLLRSSPLLEFSPTGLLIITLVGASTAFFAATCGLVQNDLKRIIAFSTISQLGYCFLIVFVIKIFYMLFLQIDFTIIMLSVVPISKKIIHSKQKSLKKIKIKDKFSSSIIYADKYNDFSYIGRSEIRKKYNKVKGIYLWINNINKRSYVGKSVNLYLRLSRYLSSNYIYNNKTKMAICAALNKYTVKNFTVYILEIVNTDKNELSEKENYWYKIINPSYNIQSILQPFTGSNHYRFGSKVPTEVKLKISNTLKGRILSDQVKANHIIGARKKHVYCYDWNTGKYLMEFNGVRIMARALNYKSISSIQTKLNKNKPLSIIINNIQYKMLLTTNKK